MKLKYHQKTFDLLDKQAVISEKALKQLATIEKKSGFLFPAAVKEWISLEGAMKLLEDYGMIQKPTFEHLHEIGEDWSGEECPIMKMKNEDNLELQDFGRGFLVFLHEYEGVFRWAVKLDGSDDPPVFIDIDSEPKIIWQWYANRFSEFIYTWFWGLTGLATLDLSAHTGQRLSLHDFTFLCQHFKQEPTTTPVYTSKVEYRFSKDDQKIIIGLEDEDTHWSLSANSPSSLFELADKLWHCGGISETLEAALYTTKAALVKKVLTKLKLKNEKNNINNVPIEKPSFFKKLSILFNHKASTEKNTALSLYKRAQSDYHAWRVIIEDQQYTFPDLIVPAEIAAALESFKKAHIEAVCWNDHELFMLINEKQATLMHRCQSGYPIAESSNPDYQGSSQALSVFCSEYWPSIQVPNLYVISREAGIGALIEFLKTGQRPNSIAWTINNEEHCTNSVGYQSSFDEYVPF